MAGLTLLLETQKSRASSSKKSSDSSPQVLNKADMVRLCRSTPRRRGPVPPPAGAGFLDACFLCKKRLSPEKDIYMYRGDRGFCSVECRMRQMSMDEDGAWMDNNKCGLVASATTSSTSTSAAAASTGSSSGRHRKSGVGKPRQAGVVNTGFAY